MITIAENLNPGLENVCLLVMFPIKKEYKYFDPVFKKKMFVIMDVTFYELTPFSTTDLQGGRGGLKI